MDNDAVSKAERRVAEAEGVIATQATRVDDLSREGRDTGAAELALAATERALELRRARLDALLSL
jgi:uncharacterized coiled-coil protein SlyX